MGCCSHSSSLFSDDVPSSNGNIVTLEKRPFDRDPGELAQYLHSSLTFGLDDFEAQNHLKLYGKNFLKGQWRVSVGAVLWRQVSNAMTVILLRALAIAFATQDFAEGGVIAGNQFLKIILIFSHCRCQCRHWIHSGIPC